MVCSGLESVTLSTIGDFLTFPLSCDYYFYAKIYGALFIIFVLILYYNERNRQVKVDIISIIGVVSIGIIFLAVIGSLIQNSTGTISMISQDILVYILVFGSIFITIWFFKGD